MIDTIDHIIDYYEQLDGELVNDVVLLLRDAEELIFLYQTGGLNANGNSISSDVKEQTSDKPIIR